MDIKKTIVQRSYSGVVEIDRLTIVKRYSETDCSTIVKRDRWIRSFIDLKQEVNANDS